MTARETRESRLKLLFPEYTGKLIHTAVKGCALCRRRIGIPPDSRLNLPEEGHFSWRIYKEGTPNADEIFMFIWDPYNECWKMVHTKCVQNDAFENSYLSSGVVLAKPHFLTDDGLILMSWNPSSYNYPRPVAKLNLKMFLHAADSMMAQVFLAFAMGAHERLGASSVVSMLTEHCLFHVLCVLLSEMGEDDFHAYAYHLMRRPLSSPWYNLLVKRFSGEVTGTRRIEPGPR